MFLFAGVEGIDCIDEDLEDIAKELSPKQNEFEKAWSVIIQLDDVDAVYRRLLQLHQWQVHPTLGCLVAALTLKGYWIRLTEGEAHAPAGQFYIRCMQVCFHLVSKCVYKVLFWRS